MIELLVVVAVIAILASLLLPALSRSKASAWNARCKGNLRQLGIVLTLFTTDNDTLPSAVLGPNVFTLNAWKLWLAPYLPTGPYKYLIGPNEGIVYSDSAVYSCPSTASQRFWHTADPAQPARFVEVSRSYGYNAVGADAYPFMKGLGLMGQSDGQRFFAVRPSSIVSPSGMFAFGDGFMKGPGTLVLAGTDVLYRNKLPWVTSTTISAETPEARAAQARHGGKGNMVFVDSHVEGKKVRDLYLDNTAPAISLWNIDHQVH